MSLYLEHFGLREPPFRITPHTDFFFTGANRGPTLDALIYAITQDEGIVKVTGEVGSGKTMLCRMLLERLPADVESLYLANPSLSRHEILGAIADELGIPADGKTTHSMIRTLQDALVERYATGKRVVILIDEAHAMPAESLEEIRLLSNLESKATKLLQIALFAQPELDDRLAANDMRQLRERITQHFNLAPLKVAEVGSYIEFRLRADSTDYEMPQELTLESGGAAQALLREDGQLIGRSLLEPALRTADMNEFEVRFAGYLDQRAALHWWHRNVAKSQLGLQGWRRHRVYPDFVFGLQGEGEARRIVLMETKGLHLAGSTDTDYKRALFERLTAAFRDERGQRSGELILEDVAEERIVCDLIFEQAWEGALEKRYFAAEPAQHD